jgi:8-oxo-dGTP diphosphatase
MKQRSRNEKQFLEQYNPSAFERPSVTVDTVILTVHHRQLEVVVVQRTEHPDLHEWSLPGGFVRIDEGLEDAATRLLRDKAGLHNVFLEQLFTFGQPDRDPRMRIISVAYYALVPPQKLDGLSTAKLARVSSKGIEVEEQPHDLAFDHNDILQAAVQRIRGKLEYAPIAVELLPERFTLRELQEVHEAILGKRINKDSFRRKVLASGELEATGDFESGQGFRPAEYYRAVNNEIKIMERKPS